MRIGFGGGCHWCTEAVFQSLVGVGRVEQGWIASAAPDDALSEAVRVTYDPSMVSLSTLVEAHLQTHASRSDHALRSRYRSAVYTTSAAQQQAVVEVLALREEAVVTRALPLLSFTENERRYRSYYLTDPDRPFSQRWIEPKLHKLRKALPDHYRPPRGET